MKISTKYMSGVIIVILVVIIIYQLVESLMWYSGTKIYFSAFSALLVGSAIGYYISNSLAKKFTELKNTAENISRGDFTKYADLSGDGLFADETADIASSINMMLDNLMKLARHITKTSMKVLQSSLNLYKLSDQVS